MTGSRFHRALLESDTFAQYSLRSTFFVRRLREMDLWKAIREVSQLLKVSSNFAWTERATWGIEADAWTRIEGRAIDPLLIFCHPRVVSEQPRLLVYYRTVALLSQKGLDSLVGGSIANVEAGRTETLATDWLNKIVIAINSIVSVMVITAADIEADHLQGLQFASAGSTIQGSWNNAIGSAGEAAVKTILLNHLKSEIQQVVWRNSTSTDYSTSDHTALLDRIGEIRVVRMKQGFHLLFSSEPDISLRNGNDIPLAAVEIKAGADPAGALERLGAAMKSFENDRNVNPRLKTVYVVRSMTKELRKRINENNPFDYTFALSDLLADERTQKTFANLILRLVLKTARK